jgi:hypothetical protein
LNLPPTNPAAQPLSTTDPRNFNGLVQCGGSGVPRGCVQGHLFNPAPRVGFAWDPWGNGRWAIRGGYGIFFEHGNGNEQNVEALEATPPLVLNPSQPNIVGYTNIGGGGGTVLAFPLGFNAIRTSPGWPYMQQWNLDVQHEFPQHFVASIAYVGSKGTHLGRRIDLNQVVPLSLSQDPYGPGQAITPQITDANGNVTYAGDCSTLTVGPGGPAITGQAAINLGIACGNDPNPNRPYVGFGSINFMQFAANSSYNALQVSVRRAIAPLTLSVAYTYSHSIDNASDGGAGNAPSFVNSYDIQRSRASSDFDQRHMLNISYVYDLPFMRHASGVGHALLADWHYSGLVAIQTGVPFSVVYSGFSDNAGVSNGSGPGTYADLVGNPNSGIPSSGGGPGPLLFNPNAFAAPRGLTFGDAGRNILHMPRTTNFDMSLLKNFRINESTGFQFRAEAFNVFNHTQWSGSSTAGAGVNNDVAGSDFLHPNSAHRARTLQFGLKFLF